MGQLNNTNFFRWYTDSVSSERSVNILRLGIQDAKMYLPVLVSGEITGFYINSDIPFYDADALANLQLQIRNANTNAVTIVGAVMQSVLLQNGYRLYASFAVPDLSVGQYTYEILNTNTDTLKCVSNYFQVLDEATANLQTVTVKWQNSRDAYYYDWSQVQAFFCQLRLHLSLSSYQAEETIDQTKAVSTGTRRNNNYDTDLMYKLQSYYFDDGANMACIPLFKADTLILNGKNYIQKTAYLPNARPQSKVSVGEIELYDQYFSTINKFGQLPQPINVGINGGNYLVINNSDQVLKVNVGAPGGGSTVLKAMDPGTIFNIPVSSILPTNNIFLNYTSEDDVTRTTYLANNINGNYVLTVENEISGVNFGNATFAQLSGNQFIAIFGPLTQTNVLPFVLAAKINQPANTLITSNAVQTGGVNQPVAISIAGDGDPKYNINGGAFTNAPGTTINGDIILVQLTSSPVAGTQLIATLTIGNQTGDFDVTTASSDFHNYECINGDASAKTINSVGLTGTATINFGPVPPATADYENIPNGVYDLVIPTSGAGPSAVEVIANGVNELKSFAGSGAHTYNFVGKQTPISIQINIS